LYVWQRKDLQTAENEILAHFSYVWQEKKLGDSPGWEEGPEKKLGGNADRCENKGDVKRGIQKLMKTKEKKIDGLPDALRVAEGWRDETGTLSAEP